MYGSSNSIFHMPRPQNKTELLELSVKNFKKLMDFVGSLSQEERDKPFPEHYMNRNVRDVLAHIHHWHLMVLDWYQTGMGGQKPDIPAKGHTWKTTPELNRNIQRQYANTALEAVKQQLTESFRRVHALIEKHTDEELFEKKRYPWTGTTSLAAYLIGATSSHYDWAFKLIKKCKLKTKSHV